MWETGNWRITGQKKWDYGRLGCGAILFGRYIYQCFGTTWYFHLHGKGTCLLGCDEVWFGRKMRTFRRILRPRSSGIRCRLVDRYQSFGQTCYGSLTRPYAVTHLPNGSGYFRANLFPYDTPTFLKPSSFYTHLPAYGMEQTVPKRRYINFRRRGITQKRAYNFLKTAKV